MFFVKISFISLTLILIFILITIVCLSFLYTSESRHVKSNMVTGVFKSMWRGMKFREFQGDMNQQGGAFICGPGNIEISHKNMFKLNCYQRSNIIYNNKP